MEGKNRFACVVYVIVVAAIMFCLIAASAPVPVRASGPFVVSGPLDVPEGSTKMQTPVGFGACVPYFKESAELGHPIIVATYVYSREDFDEESPDYTLEDGWERYIGTVGWSMDPMEKLCRFYFPDWQWQSWGALKFVRPFPTWAEVAPPGCENLVGFVEWLHVRLPENHIIVPALNLNDAAIPEEK